MFTQTTHDVAAPHGFACVAIPATRLYIPSFIKMRSGVSEPQGVKIWPFPLLWLIAFTTACTTVQAVIRVTTYTYTINKYIHTRIYKEQEIIKQIWGSSRGWLDRNRRDVSWRLKVDKTNIKAYINGKVYINLHILHIAVFKSRPCIAWCCVVFRSSLKTWPQRGWLMILIQ